MAGLLASAAATAPGLALASVKSLKLSKAFPFLDIYLGLAPAQHSRFNMVYYAYRDGHPAADTRMTIIQPNGSRVPVPVGPDGRVLRLPTLAELKSDAKLEIEAPAGSKFGMSPELHPNMEPSPHPDPAALIASLAQVNAVVASMTGLFSFAAPKMAVAYFYGAASGQAELANGHSVPLPISKAKFLPATPFFEPAGLVGARGLALAKAPSRILLGPHMK